MLKPFLNAILVFGFLILATPASSQTNDEPFAGTFVMKTEQAELTLELLQPDPAWITGTLKSTSGINFSLDGQIESGMASGVCSGNEGSVFFEIYTEGNALVLSLIEPDAYNMPDYNTATYLAFTKKDNPPVMQTKTQPAMAAEKNPTGQTMAQPNEKGIGNPGWGFTFFPPKGWTYQSSGDGLIMGHNSIPGIILIFPHGLQTIPELMQEMRKGIREEGNYLMLDSEMSALEEHILAGDYQGIMDGQQARARGFGTLSPYGGGAFIIAVSTPEMLGDAIIGDAGWIASNLQYTKIETSDLMIHFAGRWANFTTNTSTWIHFYPDGTYDQQYESSYSGELSGGGNWGAAGAENEKGRWTIHGNRDQGRITVRLASGSEIYYDYRVHEERGEKYYSEYWFNGQLYGKSRE